MGITHTVDDTKRHLVGRRIGVPGHRVPNVGGAAVRRDHGGRFRLEPRGQQLHRESPLAGHRWADDKQRRAGWNTLDR
ncbi:hypothetical protein ACFQER_02400 [Halomicroarcula sp. GCM10025894]|uniref:hypothetical protein n=1 Tax=Halomicroarcula sp. GCM10025894 TaxID=3252673 RepID=UPI003622BEA6